MGDSYDFKQRFHKYTVCLQFNNHLTHTSILPLINYYSPYCPLYTQGQSISEPLFQ